MGCLFFSYRWWDQINAAAWSAQHEPHRLRSTSKLHICTFKHTRWLLSASPLQRFQSSLTVFTCSLLSGVLSNVLRSLCVTEICYFCFMEIIMWTSGGMTRPVLQRRHRRHSFFFLPSLRNFYGPGSYIQELVSKGFELNELLECWNSRAATRGQSW